MCVVKWDDSDACVLVKGKVGVEGLSVVGLQLV